MTQLKKLKKSIRSRSEKTGESYTAARRQVLLARDKAEPAKSPETAAVTPPPPPAPPPSPTATAVKGSVSDESARKKTGHGHDHWFAVLDEFGAAAKGHTAAAAISTSSTECRVGMPRESPWPTSVRGGCGR